MCLGGESRSSGAFSGFPTYRTQRKRMNRHVDMFVFTPAALNTRTRAILGTGTCLTTTVFINKAATVSFMATKSN